MRDETELHIRGLRIDWDRIAPDSYLRNIEALSGVNITTPGEHIIAIKAFGCRINTFGQLHHIQKKEVWWGPGSWRTKGENWSYEYQFWEQGILKSPELLKALATND